jgi:hypothetical protein
MTLKCWFCAVNFAAPPQTAQYYFMIDAHFFQFGKPGKNNTVSPALAAQAVFTRWGLWI